MSNRISFGEISNRVLDRLFKNYNKLEGIQNQLSTGKKLNKASDNPVSVSQSMELRSELDQFTSFNRNIEDGMAYLGTVDSTLSTSNNLYQNMRERAIQASNDTNSSESRKFIGQEIRGMFDQMIALANTAFKGEYIFSGSNSQLPPYEMRTGSSRITDFPVALSGDMALSIGVPIQIVDKAVNDSNDYLNSDANAYQLIPGTVKLNGLKEDVDFSVNYVQGTITFLAPGANATALAPAGIDMKFNWVRRNEKDLDGNAYREIEEGVSADLNTTASQVYGSNTENNAWAAMINLMEGAINNKPQKLRESIGGLDESFKRQLNAQAMNGARVNRYESTKLRNEERVIYTTQLQSDVEDVDFAQAITDYNLQSTVYDASLKMGARALQSTLIDFI